MRKIGIYPGTFDPITYGHIDVIRRALKIVSKLIIAVSNDYSKNCLFSAEERVSIIKKALFKDLNFKTQIIKVLSFVRWIVFNSIRSNPYFFLFSSMTCSKLVSSSPLLKGNICCASSP